ncbi:glycosyltransferase family 4 protein [Dyadobacter arcticus]|uniref:Glycosyltransferase involved in cell wall biosynthesis n=1 Tax=Dyadobacter arcticus TaxID=1078754 RepID=A0ABX0UKI3_9BACT|nr:glycosyltransferase family 1 protein [Dyadobacter arcticus]NIJ53521.1 glycosyltransferase involved in cell wall biosynthesis [Dyadobacter arcticus]
MRIGFDAKRAFANKTGLGNYSRFVLEALANFENAREYLAYTPKNDRNLFPDFPKKAIRYPENWFDQKLSAYWRYAAISKQLSKDGIDIFHGLSNELPKGLSRRSIKSVVTIHDLIFERLPYVYKPVDRIMYRHKFKSACKHSDVIVAVSEQTKRDLTELYGIDKDKIKVIYQDCNPIFKQKIDVQEREQIINNYGLEKPYILSVGTLEERKNQHRLVEAFAGLKNNDFNLILVGKPTGYTQKIRATIQHYGLGNRVFIRENVPTTHLPAIYQGADIFAYISVYEGFGIPILEALHSGTPVLAAKGSCLEEAGGPGGLYADPYKTEDIRSQLEMLIADAGLRKSLVAAGQNHISAFSAEKIAKKLVNLYENLY